MTIFRMLRGACVTAACAVTLCAPATFAQPAPEAFERYAEFDEDSRIRIDYTAFDDILGGLIYEVGRSDRMPARGAPRVRTGTRISLESNSRYRYEANRAVFHALNDEHKAVISAYREELERLPSEIDLARLSSNEQLAYWLNLHNLVVIDEIAQRYPVRNIERMRVDGEPLHSAPIINIDGHRISLNDIRLNIVGTLYDDPRVIYGFFSGAVGGPTLQGRPFSGATVWSQLDANAREYVNALRGVEDSSYGFRVSSIYEEWRPYVFPEWPSDLRNHLRSFAQGEAQSTISVPDAPTFIRYDWSIADLTNGVNECGGAGTFNVLSSSGDMGAQAQNPCGSLPAHAVDLVNTVFERRLEFLRQGRMGSVTIRDIETTDTGEPVSEEARRVDLDGDPIEDEPENNEPSNDE